MLRIVVFRDNNRHGKQHVKWSWTGFAAAQRLQRRQCTQGSSITTCRTKPESELVPLLGRLSPIIQEVAIVLQ